MKSICRLLGLIAVLIVVIPTSAIQAQTNCLSGFKAADCQLMAAAGDNMPNLKSFDLGYDLSYKLTGGPGVTVTISIKGNGPIDFNNIGDSDLQTVLTQLSMSSNLTVTTVAGTNKQTTKIEMRLVEGELYFNQVDSGDGWMQISLNRILEKSPSSFDLSPIAESLRPGSPLIVGTLSGMPGVVKGQRQNGPKVEGKATAQFVVNLDYAAYYKTLKTNSDRKAFLTTFLSSFLTGSGQKPSSTRLQDPKLLAATERTVKTLKVAFLWLVSAADKMPRGLGANLSMKVDPVLAAAINSAMGNAPLVFDLKLLFTFSKIGDPVKVDPVTESTTDITDTVANALGIR